MFKYLAYATLFVSVVLVLLNSQIINVPGVPQQPLEETIPLTSSLKAKSSLKTKSIPVVITDSHGGSILISIDDPNDGKDYVMCSATSDVIPPSQMECLFYGTLVKDQNGQIIGNALDFNQLRFLYSN